MSGDRLAIALIGTRGVPARYGGFETAVEEVGRRLAARGHRVVVYCRGSGPESYLGMHLVHLPALKLKTGETLSHTAMAALHLRRHPTDVAVLFNAANAPFIPLVRSRPIPVAVHVDGLEWQRAKWGRMGRRYYRLAERLSVKWADALIADAEGIRSYYRETYGAEATYIPYGAPILDAGPPGKLETVELTPGAFHVVVARFEPENNLHLIVEAYRRSRAAWPLVVVGTSPYGSDYRAHLEHLADGDPRIRFLGAIWDQDLLNELYSHAATYIHGHSVGGTNPSLLRAMGAGSSVVAFDVIFNREVAGDTASYFADPLSLVQILEEAEGRPEEARARGAAGRARVELRYRWDAVADDYERLCRSLAA